ncbi:MAG TPA: carbohydrate-binding protein, partial [Polyangia bacterium]
GAGSDAGSGGAPGTGGMAGPAGPQAQAFDQNRGVLNVEYGSYLGKHDVVDNRPNTNPLHGLTVGNGRMGAMVWTENGLTMQVSGVDTSPQTEHNAGLVTLTTTPRFDMGFTNHQQRLSIYDGTLTTTYDDNRTITIMGAPNSEVMGIHVEDKRPGVTNVTLDLHLWSDLRGWPQVAVYADAESVGISRGQTDANRFGYTLAATVQGTAFTTQNVGGNRVRLTITPAASYTIWFACATRLNAPNNDSVAQAKKVLADVKTAGYANTLTNFKNWWHAFWAKSFVQYKTTNADGDYLENAYYLATYMIAAGAYGNYPFHFINGVFRATGDMTKWSNAYWY